jgi:ribose transport system substrate-binding protein
MRSLGRILGVLAMAAAFALMPACNSSNNSASSGQKPVVAFITNNPHEFWTIARKGTEDAAKKFDVEVEFKLGDKTSEQQRRLIEDLQGKGVAAIAVSPNDSVNQVSYYKNLNKKVPVIAVDNDIPDVDARRCYLGTDNVAAGRAVGKLIKQALPAGGKFMIFVGQLDAQNAVERRRGVVIELAGGEDKCAAELERLNKGDYPIKFGNFELLDTRTDNGQEDICLQKAQDALTKYPDIACMVGLWAYNPPAILGALKSQSRIGKVVVVGFDEYDQTLDAIRDGSVVGTVVQDPYNFGFEAVRIMAAIARGDPKALDVPGINAQKQIYVRHRIINKDGKPGSMYQDEKVEPVDPFQAKLKELKAK